LVCVSRAPSVRSGRLLPQADGGGIRGLSELLVLREIMSRIQHLENLPSPPLPCKYFDLIGGTSTGGFVAIVSLNVLCPYHLRRLIALMLGRLRMPIDECIKHYGLLSEQVFSKVKLAGDGKFSASTLEKTIKKIIEDCTHDTEARMMDPRPENEVCRTCVLSTNSVDTKLTETQFCLCYACGEYDSCYTPSFSHVPSSEQSKLRLHYLAGCPRYHCRSYIF
jgi:hypothetical protein